MALNVELGGQGVECWLLRERALERWSGGLVRHQQKAYEESHADQLLDLQYNNVDATTMYKGA